MANRAKDSFRALATTGVGVLLLAIAGATSYPYLRSWIVISPTSFPSATAEASALVLSPLVKTEASSSVLLAGTPSVTSAPAIPSRIVIPAIGVDAPVVPVSTSTIEVDGQRVAVWDVPDSAAGWHQTSAPLGAGGNTVLNGHNATLGEIFRDLYTLKAGDVITVYAGDASYGYRVAEVLILLEAGQPLETRLENARYILPTTDERLTLVTCHPYGSLRNRLIVIAYPAN